MPDARMGVVIAFDSVTGKELFRDTRATSNVEGSTLPFPGGTYITHGRRYKVQERLPDAYTEHWTISVSDEGPADS